MLPDVLPEYVRGAFVSVPLIEAMSVHFFSLGGGNRNDALTRHTRTFIQIWKQNT
jgi:hypothetical protein